MPSDEVPAMPSDEVEPITHTCPHCQTLIDVSDEEPFSEIICPSCHSQMRVRTTFDHFELQEAIASGGMGTVYKALDTNLNRIVALKLLRKEFSIDQEYIEKLETEAKITASVNHPNVVKVFSFGCDNGLYYIAMELVDKGSLDDLMSLQGKIAEIQVLEIGVQVAQGLRAAVEAGLIHRDVKPGNILFADAHTSKIVDFGLAMPLEQAQDAEEEIWGTPYYVAPEKLNHEPEDFRSDIYSLGGTLFHALAGRPPFEAENASLVALKHLKSQAVSLQAFAPDISSATSYVINRTLAKDPEDRYQSYDELIEHLIYAKSKLEESTSKPREPKARVVVEGAEQQTVMGYILMGVIGLVLLAGILLFVFRDKISMMQMTPEERERVRLLRTSGTPEERYANARDLLGKGEAEAALPTLWALSRRPNLAKNFMTWVLYNEAAAAYASSLPGVATNAVNRLRKEVGGEIDPFSDEFSRVLDQAGNPSALATLDPKNWMQPGAKAAGLLLSGLREWEAGRYERAATFFNAFLQVPFTGEWEWQAHYKPLVEGYLADFKIAGELPKKVREANNDATRKTALEGLKAAAPKLQRKGHLTNWVHTQIDTLSTKPGQGPAPSDNALALLRNQARRHLQDFAPEQAGKVLKEGKIAPAQAREWQTVRTRYDYTKAFKEGLIKDINKQHYFGELLRKKDGKTVIGRVKEADENGLKAEDGTSVKWSELPAKTISQIAESFITSRSGDIPSRADVQRLWNLGVYQMLSGEGNEGFSRLMRAAEVDKDYPISLFDPSAAL